MPCCCVEEMDDIKRPRPMIDNKKANNPRYKIKKDGEICFVCYDDFDIIRSI